MLLWLIFWVGVVPNWRETITCTGIPQEGKAVTAQFHSRRYVEVDRNGGSIVWVEAAAVECFSGHPRKKGHPNFVRGCYYPEKAVTVTLRP